MPHALAIYSASFKTSQVPAAEHANFDTALSGFDTAQQGSIIDFFRNLKALLAGKINWGCLFSVAVLTMIVAGNFMGALQAYLACAAVVPAGLVTP